MRRIKNVVLWMLVSVILVSAMNLEALAAEIPGDGEGGSEVLEAIIEEYQSDSEVAPITSFGNATISVTRGDRGMVVCIITAANGTASIIGVKDIKIKHKVWWGWDTVATSSGGYMNNSGGMSCTVYYPGAIQGDTYKISCVHYADVDGYRELPSETTDFIYNF